MKTTEPFSLRCCYVKWRLDINVRDIAQVSLMDRHQRVVSVVNGFVQDDLLHVKWDIDSYLFTYYAQKHVAFLFLSFFSEV